jgi:ABC-type sugar transport system ATPase subunit
MTVTLEHVTRTVDGIPAIRDVSLTLERGTLSVLLGPTLSGKTSIMRLLAGLDTPTSGRVLVDGKDVTGLDVRQRSVAMVYQQFINYPSLTVYENIASPLRVQRRPREEIEKRVREAAQLLKLEPYLDRTPLQLSGGQQQRTAIARALVKGADLVLLDEPLANLDYKLREELRTELPRIFEASGAIFVYATTEPSEALLLGGRTVCMWEGEVLQAGDTSKVYRHPDTLRVAQVFSDPPAQHRRDRETQRFGTVCRRSGGARLGALCHARRRRLPRRLPRPSARGRQGHRRPPRLSRHRDRDRDHRLGKFRASQPRRLQLGRGAAGRARIRAGPRARRRARSRQRLCVRRGRPPGRRAGQHVRDIQHGPH